MKRVLQKRWPLLLLFAVAVACAARILALNTQWPAAKVTIIPRGEAWDNEGVQVEVIDSVLGSARETLAYYDRSTDSIAEEDVLSMMDQGWHGYIMAVKLRAVNTTGHDILMGQYTCTYAESISWYNGYAMMALPLYNDNYTIEIAGGESAEIVLPYMIYREHFLASDWKSLARRAIYLDSNFIYPQKIQLDCTPVLLESAQKEFHV